MPDYYDIPTVCVKVSTGYAIINESDYDEAIHGKIIADNQMEGIEKADEPAQIVGIESAPEPPKPVMPKRFPVKRRGRPRK